MLDRFYPIVPDSGWVETIVPLGVKFVQLRVKDVAEDEVSKQISQALSVCRQHDCTLVVNDYWREAIDLGADFVHLGQEDLAEADINAIRRAGIRLGVSTHTHDELDRALAVAPDYVALGPIYETTLKVMRYDPQGLDRIGEWKRMISCPLVAVGGITLERAPDVFAAGADSIAVVTDVVKHPKPEQRVKDWLAASSGRNSQQTEH